MRRYNPKEIEPKWQKIWEENGTYTANLHSDKPKYIAMSMFNYPSGAGIHIGHAMNYTISDVKARFKRQQGYESYHPVGWDAFGLPAENYAIKAGVSPQASMATVIPSYHKQYKAMGWSNDLSKEISTHEPEYYKWTQWIFSQMYKHGLAYQDVRMQWWCEKCQTVLANEQVIDGKCWRHDGPDDPIIQQKEVKQWFFKITEYADELLEAIDDLDWTESVKLAQINWIGKSIGADIDFKVVGSDQKISVFTTRADTIFSAAFIVLAPEHDLVTGLITPEKRAEVEAYIKKASLKSELERQAVNNKEKTGVFTGTYAINPANEEKIPIWIADFVLAGYGTGAVFGDIHDERDFEFARKYDIRLRQTIAPIVVDQSNPPRSDREFTQRIVAHCIVKHPSEEKVLTLRWKNHDWHTFITGGIEEGEEPDEAAAREITEETGYKNLRFVKEMPLVINSHFYAAHKDVNRDILVHVLLFELQDLGVGETNKAEHENFETEWWPIKDIAKLHPVSELAFIERWLKEGDFAYTGEGRLINSGEFSGMTSYEARDKIIEFLAERGQAAEKINYKMRDWSVSRQRYWGAPIPIVNCQKCGPVLVPDDQLPVILPELDDFQPSGDGRSALARASDWLKVDCPQCHGQAERETDTLDTYICSSWYMFRYFDPYNSQAIFDSTTVNKWMPVDFYNGGDHATAHLLYARFVARFFHKIGLVDKLEPFKSVLFNGKVTAQDGSAFSKSKGNGVDPLEIINSGYGADALRTYLMFAAPLEFSARWDPQGVPGAYRFLSRLWTLIQEYLASELVELSDTQIKNIRFAEHSMIKKTSEDLESSHYNTAISALMSCVNDYYKLKTEVFGRHETWQSALESLIMAVAPLGPHICDELWSQMGHEDSVTKDHWPVHNDAYLQLDTIKIVIQVNGKVRAELHLAAGISEEDAVKVALDNPQVQKYVAGKEVKKVVYVPGRIISLVV